MQYIVGFKLRGKSGHLTVCAEDALIAALKAKTQQPDSTLTYVRRQNKRGDTRNPSANLATAAE
jgi:cytidine deaminase